jgi:hypothetical protein
MFWMIADIAQSNATFSGEFLDQKKAPRFMHPTREQAEIELLRLQGMYPDGEFVLLEAVAVARPRVLLEVTPIQSNEIPF